MRWIYHSSNYGVVIKVWIKQLFSSLLTLLLNLLYPINDSLQYLFYCRSSHWRSYLKRNILKTFKVRRTTLASESFFKKVACASESLLNKVEGLRQTLVQVFSYEFCEIFKNTLFTEKLRVTASVIYEWFIIFIYLRTENFHPQTFID